MKTSTLQPNLNKACKQVSKALAKRATLPVCTHIKLETHQGMLRLTATDLDSAIMVDIGAMNDEDGAICVPGKLFSQIVAKAPKERIDMHTEDNTLIIRIGNSDMRLTGLDAEDFPPIPNVFEPYAEIVADELLEAINQTAYATADEDTRPVLQAVCLTPKEDALEFAAADGFRLAVRKAYAETHSDKQILVRGESLAKLAVNANGFLNKLREPVKIMYHEVKGYENTVYDDAGNVLERTGEYVQSEQVAFIMGYTTMICQCVRGTFPNYQVLIPLNHNTRIRFDREAMLSAVSSLKPVVAEGSGIVRLELTPQWNEMGRLSLCGRSEQIGDMRHELDCHYEDSGIDTPARRIAFNCAYLHDLLKCLKSDTVTLEITTPSSPGVFYPSFQSSIDDERSSLLWAAIDMVHVECYD